MVTFVNLVLLIAFICISIRIFGHSFDKKRCFVLPDRLEYSYRMDKRMFFLMFVVCTAPFFLAQFALIKYLVYFLFIIWLMCRGQLTLKIESITGAYLLFYGWLIVSCFYADFNYDSFSLLVKYILPLLSLWLGYSAIDNKYDLYFFSKSVTKSAVIYALLIGGFCSFFISGLYYFIMGSGVFLMYAGLADYLTSLSVIPLILWWMTRRKRYIFASLFLLASSVLDSVRTGIGGIVIVYSVFAFFKYKVKSIPVIALLGITFLSVILFVPQVNEKFFGDDAGKVSANDIVEKDALSLDNINTSGRSALWELALKKFYEPDPICGAGLGEVTKFIKERAEKEHTIALLHSDYVQILCDNGIVGIILLSIFFAILFFKVFRYTWWHNDAWVKITGTMAAASLSGVAFSMGFDNVVSHSMTSLINPFIFIGFFLKFVDLSKHGKLS